MTLVSIIIPYAPYHTSIVEQAIAAARSQSLPCDVIPVADTEQLGAGAARNRGVALSDTPFVLFCDADDVLREDAVERMVFTYRQNHYVYCDNTQGDSVHQTPDYGVWHNNESWHAISALVPTVAFKAVGGFNETLPALEDKDFFLRLQAKGYCGVRCPHLLLRYTGNGQRSSTYAKTPQFDVLSKEILERWNGAAKMCCGEAAVTGVIPDGKQDDFILVTTLYTPMQQRGLVTGNLYPRARGVNNYQIWVDPRDVDHPNGQKLWSPVMTVDKDATPAVDEVVRLAREAMGT